MPIIRPLRSSTKACMTLSAAMVFLAGCTSIAGNMAEREMNQAAAKIEAEGTPELKDPQFVAWLAQFERDHAQYGTDPANLPPADGGRTCGLDATEAWELVTGHDYATYTKGMNSNERLKMVVDLDSVKLHVVEGDCAEHGIADGPARLRLSWRQINRHQTDESRSEILGHQATVRATIFEEMVTTTWRDGKRDGPTTMISMNHSVEFEEDPQGNLVEKEYGFDFVKKAARGGTASYRYRTYEAGVPERKTLSVIRLHDGVYRTSIIEPTGPNTARSRHYIGDTLATTGHTKDGVAHGWNIIHPHTGANGWKAEGQRTCYQNGERVEALDCPSG